MSKISTRMRQLVDWSAAIWAGIISGIAFLLLSLFLTPYFTGGNAWVMLRLFASVFMGEGILAPPATYELSALIVGILSNFIISLGFALLLAYIIHRGGLITGIIGGAVFGLGVYCINFYTLTIFYPWFFAMRSSVMIANHVIFGAIAGGIYEWLEVEEFVSVNDEPEG